MAVPQLASNEPALHTPAPNQFALKHIAPNLAIPPLIPPTGISASHGPFRGFPTPRCRDAPSASPIELSPIEFTGPRPDGSSPDTVFSRQRTAGRAAHGSKVKGLTQTRHCRLSSVAYLRISPAASPVEIEQDVKFSGKTRRFCPQIRIPTGALRRSHGSLDSRCLVR
jgi:hypothetical protein